MKELPRTKCLSECPDTSQVPGAPVLEPLEDRLLLSVLGVTPDYQQIVFDSLFDLGLSYKAGTGALSIDASPYGFLDPAIPPPPLPVTQPATFDLNIIVNSAGEFVSGVAGDDLVVTGVIDTNGDGTAEYSGVLLTGEALDFGFEDSAYNFDLYDLRLAPTGGALFSFYTGKEIALRMQSRAVESTFTGDFGVDFAGPIEGALGPTESVVVVGAEIDIEKYVQPVGGEGLTPGFWKQCQHFQYWTGYEPSDSYNGVFGVSDPDDPALLEALWRGGGDANALGRHAVAALLNAAHPDVDYAFTEAEIIALVQNAYATGDYEATKDLLAAENEKDADVTDGGAPAGYGDDADDPTGPVVDVGDWVLFTYVVTNPDEAKLANVTVVDDNATPGDTSDDFSPLPILDVDGIHNIGDTDADDRLDVGEEWLYTAKKIVTAGQHINIATVTGTPVGEDGQIIGEEVTDDDPAHWFGGQALTASLGDFVWHDMYHDPGHLVDGIQDAGESGIEDVIVNLLDGDGVVLNSTTTDSSGYYEFTGLEAGTYVVEISPDNFLPGGVLEGWYATLQDAGTDDAVDSDGDLDTHRSGPVTLDTGEHNPTNDFGFFRTPAIDIEKYVKPLVGPSGGEGLTPGFWKQSQHLDAWVGFSPSDSYEAIFGVDVPCSDPTLLQALWSGGGGVNALLRHSTAALLNAAHPNVEYAFTQAEIIAMVQSAFATGDYENVKDQFEAENERGADLVDGGSGTAPNDLGEDADEPTGPVVEVGDTVMFTYVVTNTGDVPLIHVVVTDDNETPGDSSDDFNPAPVEESGYNIGDTDQDGQLDPGEEWLYTATKTVTEGQHVNIGVVTATTLCACEEVTDEDPAHWLGEVVEPLFASLGDFVWHDLHHGSTHLVDGIQDVGEPGIAGVTVNLMDDSGTVLVDTATTDAAGYYEFTGLPAGAYIVEVASENFAPGGVLDGWYATLQDGGSDDAADSDGDPATFRFAPATLAAGEHDPTIDFGFFRTCVNLIKTGPDVVQGGDTITYHFRVENCGDVVLHGGAQVYDALINPCGDHQIWSDVLQPGEVAEFDRTYTTTPCDFGELVNTATAEGHPKRPDGVYLSNVSDVDSWVVLVESSTPTMTIHGAVWEDANDDGFIDLTEAAIEGVTVRLTGTTAGGEGVELITLTDEDGVYMFTGLQPSDANGYAIEEVQPDGYDDGADILGTVDEVLAGFVDGNDKFSGIVLELGQDGEDYNFAERLVQTAVYVTAGQTATIGFWQNKRGQALIRSLNGGKNGTDLGNWLAQMFPNMYGELAGDNNLAGKTNAEVAEFYRDLFKQYKRRGKHGWCSAAKLDPQVMAVALATYVTNESLAGTAARAYGFTTSASGVGDALFDIDGTLGAGSAEELFGPDTSSILSVLEILYATNSQAHCGILFDTDGDGTIDWTERILQSLANVLFTAINEAGDIN